MNNDFERPDIVEMVPAEARRILDVGCGTGRVCGAIKQRGQDCYCVGLDMDGDALQEAVAQGRIDEHLLVNLDSSEELHWLGYEPFDCIICSDVLEHLHAPEALLARLRALLTDDGVLIVSVPNARNWQVVCQLIEGNWHYEPAGLLDRTHLRFYTRRTAEQLLDQCGFVLTRQKAIAGPGYDEWEDAGKPARLKLGRTEIHDLPEADAVDFYAYQWLFAARKSATAGYPSTTIVIPVLNGLDLTQNCVQSIRKHTPEPHDIIVVDNGSKDGTAQWCEAQGIRCIRNEENRGFPAACNQGIVAASGERILLLNNDTLVTPGWLRRMHECMDLADVGLVGPRSNQISGHQKIATPGYRSPLELDGWAWEWGKRRRGECYQTNRLVGFCLMIERAVVEAIGLLDEEFGIGNYEDEDYGKRAELAGFKLLVANAAFVHHYGSQTFAREGIDYTALMAQNAARMAQKYGGTRA